VTPTTAHEWGWSREGDALTQSELRSSSKLGKGMEQCWQPCPTCLWKFLKAKHLGFTGSELSFQKMLASSLQAGEF
jgi:hypothetical protein